MTKITKRGNPIKKGCYVNISEIKDTEEWKKVIDTLEEQPTLDMSHIPVSKNLTPIEYKFVNDLSINMNQTKEERVSELGEEGWILGGIEPTGTYVFYREKR